MYDLFDKANYNVYAQQLKSGIVAKNIWNQPNWSITELVKLKQGKTVSVVLPALNEAQTIGTVVKSIKPLMQNLVDEIVVIDSGSSDDTVKIVKNLGVKVFSKAAALPNLTPCFGKGEALWRSLAVTTGDLIVFMDSDLIDPDPMFVPNLLGPLLINNKIQLVKAFYQRPYNAGEINNLEGGRVTELLVRPLLAALKPELTVIIQPLSGEYAGTRSLLQTLPFAPGYGVEIGLLIDTFDKYGIEVIAQVNLGYRSHRNRILQELGGMSRQVLATLLMRCGINDSGSSLLQFELSNNVIQVNSIGVSFQDRPPIVDLVEN